MTTLLVRMSGLVSLRPVHFVMCECEKTRRGPWPGAISRCFRTETSIRHQSPLIFPKPPPALQHDEYKNWWVIDKTGPVEDRGFILHINYRAIFHYSQPLSHSDNTGLVELFLSSDNTLVFTIGRYLRKQSTGEPLPIAKKSLEG